MTVVSALAEAGSPQLQKTKRPVPDGGSGASRAVW
eukprot:CAMPEP_0119112584 /NCGR_PEP_ID=MMETSP1180-20130426/40889_1 /TAXON_ID=3052 ORGANISM="Chlamydomonas cf sp, Strain CCMP681" /NCGR_SAMPLE_ID=MMETSP1180 /ASSEMBLY_ACC=CAM_ASM_000741 /LENGTH=34 /DNA_ID= /DNA_START= /DNA_END= /DNA_ORIENTATION=